MIEDMKALSNDSDSNEEAVTSEMIEAGATAILERVGGADLGGWFSAEELATRVYLAMAALNGSRQYPSNMKALRSIAEGATTGPWYVYRGEDGEAISVAKFVEGDNGGTTGKSICRMPVPTYRGHKNAITTRAEIDANAALIAALPSLLDRITELESLVEALKSARGWVVTYSESATAKADLKIIDRALSQASEETGG